MCNHSSVPCQARAHSTHTLAKVSGLQQRFRELLQDKASPETLLPPSDRTFSKYRPQVPTPRASAETNQLREVFLRILPDSEQQTKQSSRPWCHQCLKNRMHFLPWSCKKIVWRSLRSGLTDET